MLKVTAETTERTHFTFCSAHSHGPSVLHIHSFNSRELQCPGRYCQRDHEFSLTRNSSLRKAKAELEALPLTLGAFPKLVERSHSRTQSSQAALVSST